jgi:hypothetical protein
MRTLNIIIVLLAIAGFAKAQPNYYDVNPGDGNGLRFWSNDLYKISMGNNSQYHFGVVTDYSIKSGMNNAAGQGWTWGVNGQAPIAAIDNTGRMQLASHLYVGGNTGVTGKLGIGTNAPGYALHMAVSNDCFVIGGNTSTFQGGDIFISRNGSSSVVGKAPSIEFYDITNSARNYIQSSTAGLQIFSYTAGNFSESMRVAPNGNVIIGTNVSNGYKLAVEGTIGAREVNVNALTWSDYVFAPEYKLPSLTEVERFIKQNNHLPDVPTAKEVEEKGVNVGEMNALLLKKIEEMTLYMIEMRKEIDELKAKK